MGAGEVVGGRLVYSPHPPTMPDPPTFSIAFSSDASASPLSTSSFLQQAGVEGNLGQLEMNETRAARAGRRKA